MFTYARIDTDDAGVETIEPWGRAGGSEEPRFFNTQIPLDPANIWRDPKTGRLGVREVLFDKPSIDSAKQKYGKPKEVIGDDKVAVIYPVLDLTAEEISAIPVDSEVAERNAMWATLAELVRVQNNVITALGALDATVRSNPPKFKMNMPELAANRMKAASAK